MNRRGFLLSAALLASLAWAGWAVTEGDGAALVQARPRAPAADPSPPGAAGVPARPGAPAQAPALLELPVRPPAPAQARNVFAAYSYEAPRVRASAPPPEPPHAPPLPFRFTGRLVVDGKPTYLLLDGDTPVSATLGTEIGEFKLVTAERTRLVFLHGPTGELVALPIAPNGTN